MNVIAKKTLIQFGCHQLIMIEIETELYCFKMYYTLAPNTNRYHYEIECLNFIRMPLLTSWVGRNKIPYPVGTILSLMAREGT